MAQLFGFVQFDFAGSLPLADGRYLVREERQGGTAAAADEGHEEEGDERQGRGRESVLVLHTLGAPPPPRRRRWRPRDLEPLGAPSPLPLTRVTAVRAFSPFSAATEASGWLNEATETEAEADALIAAGIGLLNRALHARAIAAADPHGQELTPERALATRIGYGEGEEIAAGRFAAARQVDVLAGAASRRRRRQEDLRPQERLAAMLGGREQAGPCELLLLRARADLDAGRRREAALQLRAGLAALLAEPPRGLDDPGHTKDLATLERRRSEADAAAAAALSAEPNDADARHVRELLETCERILRRHRLLARP